MSPTDPDDRSLFSVILSDGRPLLRLTALCLLLSGAFAMFQASTGHFLPHDAQFLQMSASDLCAIHECRIVHFMIHDRVSFGGVLVAIGMMYLWLIEFPLGSRQPWAWWVLLISAGCGFLSFLTYLGYGYLDTWHGLATMILFPLMAVGLWLAWRRLPVGERGFATLVGPLSRLSILKIVRDRSRAALGQAMLIFVGVGLIAGGLTIATLGMTSVFVPTDLTFMGLDAAALHAINPRLVPLIAHDRAGFGGGVACLGFIVFLTAACAPRPTRSLRQTLALAGIIGFGAALGVHPAIGYNNLVHLSPAVAGCAIFFVGVFLFSSHTSDSPLRARPTPRRAPDPA